MIPELDTSLLTSMQQVGNAFAFLASLLKLNGRRLERAYRESRTRVYPIQPQNAARFAPMAPRRIRRSVWLESQRKTGIPWRFVVGHVGVVPEGSHADAIASMRMLGDPATMTT